MSLRSSEPHMVDELTSAQRLQLNTWTGVAAVLGLLLGTRVAMTGVNPLIAVPAGLIGLPLFMRLMMRAILGGAGGLARQLYNPSGKGTPSRPAYSHPESLAVRGRFEEAIAAYEAAAEEEPGDPEPWLRIARIEHADLRRPRRALEALRAARARVSPESATGMLIAREIAELYLGDLHEPPRAMPELARLAAGFPGTPTGDWALQQHAALRARVVAGDFDQWVKQPQAHRPGPVPPDSPPAPESPESPELPMPPREKPGPAPQEAPAPASPDVPVGPEGPGAPPTRPGPDGPLPEVRP